MDKDGIHYSQCWEDPNVLLAALAPSSEDSILSITSGGDNTLALLSKNPTSLVSIDVSAAQNYLLELKLAALETLSHDEALAFLGARGGGNRLQTYEKIRPALTREADAWWSAYPELIARGAVHAGRFDRFVAFFARHLIPLVHSRRTIAELLSFTSVPAQEKFYRERWNTALWRLLFGAATNRLMLRRARQARMSAHAPLRTSAVYEEHLTHLLSKLPAKGNYFLEYSLTGGYGDALPPYLETQYVPVRAPLTIACGALEDYLSSVPDHSFSVFNLSDIFDGLTDEQHTALWREIVRTAKPDARVAYWTNLIERPIPEGAVHEDAARSEALHAQDRVFFYGGFHLATVRT